MVTKTGKTPPKKLRSGRGVNYLIAGSDGKLLLASGSTGEIRTLTAEEAKQVLPLLKQRQQLGRQLADVLLAKGFALGPGDIIDLEVGTD
jgi:hypothetical protein